MFQSFRKPFLIWKKGKRRERERERERGEEGVGTGTDEREKEKELCDKKRWGKRAVMTSTLAKIRRTEERQSSFLGQLHGRWCIGLLTDKLYARKIIKIILGFSLAPCFCWQIFFSAEKVYPQKIETDILLFDPSLVLHHLFLSFSPVQRDRSYALQCPSKQLRVHCLCANTLSQK